MADPAESQLLVDTSTPPDVMNDPQYETNTPGGEDGPGDPDTCRICRGEGSDTEPLFHPCKCSGSIKHVHQDCLMEWLSHSQKKHCELCKTPFRFTKLYSPNMPQSLPTGVFFRHFLLHSVRNIAIWLRLCLVVTVWLGILPYMIRQVWRLLFWFSDGGWPSRYLTIDATRNSTAIQALEMARELQLASLSANGTSPVTPFNVAHTTSASVGGIMEKLVGFLLPFSQTLNISGADPLAAGLFKSLYYGFGIQSVVIPEGPVSNTSVSQFIMGMSPAARTPSLLSDINFLKNLTRYSTVNRFVISIAEGYIITILVVVCFILVFLIREWVVQQQPGINMGAGFNAEFAPGDRVAERGRDQAAQVDRDGEARDRVPVFAEGQRPIARPRRRNNNHDGDENRRRPRMVIPEENEERPDRPTPVRDALTPAADIQRQLIEEPRMTEEFLAIWRRADSDPKEVLRIIEHENKGDQMRYWVNAMKILQNPNPPRGNPEEGPSTPKSYAGSGSTHLPPPESEPHSSKAQASSDQGSASGESWVDVPKPLHDRDNITAAVENTSASSSNNKSASSLDKGKGKAVEENLEPLLDLESQLLPGISPETSSIKLGDAANKPLDLSPPPLFTPHVSRPRAISDGPQLRDNISPLANNNWTFGNLPVNEDTSPNSTTLDEKDVLEDPSSKAFTGESAATFKGKFDFPPNPFAEDQNRNLQIWKASQDLRVQQAIAKGREAQKSALEKNIPSAVDSATFAASDFDGPIQVKSLDGVVRTSATIEEVFANNPVPPDSEDGQEENDGTTEHNPFAPDTPLPAAREPIVARPVEPQGIFENVADWLWGGAERQDEGANEEHIVEDLAAEAPFVPVAHRDAFDQGEEFPEQDREVVEAAIAAGIDPNDPDAIDDAEDFEGIMELVGMRGPVFSLVQNALFSAFLLALTVAFGVWIPYNIGRISLLLTANPGPALKLPLRLVFSCAALLQDFAVSVLGLVSYCVLTLVSFPINLLSATRPDPSTSITAAKWGSTSLRLSQEAMDRIMDGTVNGILNFTDSDIFAFSAASHESLLKLKWFATDTLEEIGRNVIYLFIGDYNVTLAGIRGASSGLLKSGWTLIVSLPGFLSRPLSLDIPKRATPLDLELSVWDGMDRFWATLAGYTALSLLGALYVKKGSPFSNGQVGREWEATIIDLLNQAGGVMKVILIISIEMLVFPLYCGLLLDAALLPLFENATIMSRILFTFKSPLTSIFVHWFVGTCYMFHFALFVSMCRKIMRKGVLYFIRDPDDPTFHPVRDVLERNVTTQLRKILFSALVYGALVVICLGGVVWGLAFAFNGVLPIHWSSNEPVLEFPIDLLFYNFLMPLAVRFFKPSDGLHAMYKWWFQQCARMLRLTWFMFDDRKMDEEGHVVRRSWWDLFRGFGGDPLQIVKANNQDDSPFKDPGVSAYIQQDGRYVRAPASDQVRIPKGTQIFLDVDEDNNRIDGKWDRPDGVHGRDSDLYKLVYIPPYFRLRICAFIISIWLFAALTGVCITIVPLVFGRKVFSKIIPTHVRKNDVYAFSIGIYILGSALYILLHARHFFNYLSNSFSWTAETPSNVFRHVRNMATRFAKIVWTYSAFVFLLPTLFAFLLEFYAILPLHTYFSPTEPHTIHFVQSWTLGLLYVKLTTRVIQFYPDSRPAASLRLIVRDGYLNPDARLATRSFILPATLVLSTALFWPWAIARLAVMTVFCDVNESDRTLIYRYIYPAVLVAAGLVYLLYLLALGVKGWRMRIRDEVYLIGERLHNFGERKAGSGSGSGTESVRAIRRIET